MAMLMASFPAIVGGTVVTAQSSNNFTSAILSFNTDGTTTAFVNGTVTNVTTGFPCRWLSGGNSANYWIRFNAVSGSAVNLNMGVWQSLASTLTAGISVSNTARSVGTFTYDIAADAAGAVVLYTSPSIVITANGF